MTYDPSSGASSLARYLPRLIIAGVMVVIAFGGYYCSTQTNPITGEKQHVGNMTPEQEISLGLQAASEMINEMGGESAVTPDALKVKAMGAKLTTTIPNNPYKFEFHLLNDRQTINAFALPGGQVFITRALFDRLQTEAQLAGVLGHEVGHVIHRHGAQHMASEEFYQGLAGAAAAGTGNYSAAQIAQYVANLRMLKYSRDDESQADMSGMETMVKCNFDPRAQAQVMQILKDSTKSTGHEADIFATHPNPDKRIEDIHAWLKAHYPGGVPETLTAGAKLH